MSAANITLVFLTSVPPQLLPPESLHTDTTLVCFTQSLESDQ